MPSTFVGRPHDAKTLGHPSALSLDGLPDSENPSLLFNLELERSGTEGQRGCSSVELGV